MSLDILVLTDLHFPLRPTAGEARHGNWMRLFYRKALRKLQHDNITPGLVILLGDLLDDADSPDAEYNFTLLAEEFLKDNVRVLAVPGNHDNAPRVAQLFNSPAGLHIAGDYGFLVFHDTPIVDQPYEFLRSDDDLALPERIAREHPGLPLIALQHPPLANEIPANLRLRNSTDALAAYDRAGVRFSLSGHAHKGHAPAQYGPTTCITLPAFCESPFTFLHLRLDGETITPTFHQLKLPDDIPLADTHCHTAFAQCASGATTAENQHLARLLGLHTLTLTEHVFQLYLPSPVSWSFKWQSDPTIIDAVWQTPNRGRMVAYKNFINAQRRDGLLLGLELDLYDHGKLLLHADDFAGWDLFLGAMHRIQDAVPQMLPGQFEALFMRDLRALLAHPIDILAHPLRIFKSNNIPAPLHLFDEIARLLHDANVAAEINFHDTPPDPRFFEICLRRNVKLSLGSDTHTLPYVADLHPHLNFLRNLGLAPADFPRVLFDPHNPPRRAECG